MENIKAALTDILERAELECEWARKAGEKQGNYRHIALTAKKAIRDLERVK